MSARWLSIRVELISGHGRDYDPPPGRVFAVPSTTSFADLALAIDQAFGRWDLAHLRRFMLADGTVVSDPETNDDAVNTPFGPIPKTLGLTARVGSTLRNGDRFEYEFDFGDQWEHRCHLEGRTDPPGPVNLGPVITWGWGALPDQYGRRWEGDDGTSEPPPRDETLPAFHDRRPADLIDLRAFRVAVQAADPTALVETITGVELDHALQQLGAGLVRTHIDTSAGRRRILEAYLLSLHLRLLERDWAGDPELAEIVLAILQQSPSELLRVDLDDLIMETSPDRESLETMASTGFLNVETGEIAPAIATDAALVGEDAVVDVEGPAWIELDEDTTDDQWQDLAVFAAAQQAELRVALERTIQGKGAFARFHRAVHDAGLTQTWTAFSDDRRIGRARAALARHDVRPI